MHTLRIILGGFLLLGVCLLVGRWIGGAAAVVGVAIKCFLVLWLIATLINMWVGVSKAGYSIQDEAQVALLVFAVPAITSIPIWWRTSYLERPRRPADAARDAGGPPSTSGLLGGEGRPAQLPYCPQLFRNRIAEGFGRGVLLGAE